MIYYLRHFRRLEHNLLSATSGKMSVEKDQLSISKMSLEQEYIVPSDHQGEPLRMESFHTSRPVDHIQALQLFSNTNGCENIMVYDIMEMRLFKHNLVLEVIKYDGTIYPIDFISWHKLKETAHTLAKGRVARHSKYPTLITNLMSCWFPYRELIVLRPVPKPDELRAQREKLHAELHAQFQARGKATHNDSLRTIPEEDHEASKIEVVEIPQDEIETNGNDEDIILHVETITQKEMLVVEVPPLQAHSSSLDQVEDKVEQVTLNKNQVKVEVYVESPKCTSFSEIEMSDMGSKNLTHQSSSPSTCKMALQNVIPSIEIQTHLGSV